MGHDSPTQPAWPVKTKSKAPWWAVALITGLGIGASIVTALGIASARASEPKVATATMVPQSDDQAQWRVRMEQKIDEALQRIAHIEGRLDKR